MLCRRRPQQLSYILRHHPHIARDAHGFVDVSTVIAALGITEEELHQMVVTDSKQRYHLVADRIRAVQGHSVQLHSPLVYPLTPHEIATISPIHMTTPSAWELIKADGLLRKMGRTHIHFAPATSPHLLRWKGNGLQKVRLCLNLQAAALHHNFFMAHNGVILCEGPIPLCYFHVNT